MDNLDKIVQENISKYLGVTSIDESNFNISPLMFKLICKLIAIDAFHLAKGFECYNQHTKT